MTTSSVRVFHKLEGLFSIYKPPGVHWKLVRDTVETNLLKERLHGISCHLSSSFTAMQLKEIRE
ncbi:unnamed protein product [Coregonus sp. 'balchen']|nr:unnamed protein product [Coregonus sp. 'balchen']